MSELRRFVPLALTLAFNVLGVWLFVRLGQQGFPGEASRCLEDFVCYCEQTERAGLARQPFNTWSNLAVVPVSLAIGYDVSRPATDSLRRLGLTFALAVSCQGLASMFFHGSLTNWGAILDGVSIFFVLGLVLTTNLVRAGALRPARLAFGVGGSLAVALGYRLLLAPVMAPLFVIGGALVVLSERRARRRERGEPGPWFGRALWLLGAGAACWGLSLMPGFPLCSDSFRYGHPLWHVLAAGASGALWLHTRRVARPHLAARRGDHDAEKVRGAQARGSELS